MVNQAGELVLTPLELPERSMRTSGYMELAKGGASLDALQKFMDLCDREEARQAKMAFTEAKARFFAEEIRITKDKLNKQYGSNYTSLGNLVNTVRPFLGKYQFDVRWEVDQSNPQAMHVTCVLTHEQGHSERVTIIVPPDTSGQKNPIQQIKSAITYARNLTFETVCGLASTDGSVNVDDDGNSAYGREQQPGKHLGDEEYLQLLDGIQGAGNLDELKKLYGVALAEASKAGDDTAKGAFNKAKNQRYRELANAR